MDLEKYLEWYRKYDEVEKFKLISKQSILCKNLAIRRKKALDAELDYGFNRIGIRGGKFTSLNAKSQNITKQFLENQELLVIMIKNL